MDLQLSEQFLISHSFPHMMIYHAGTDYLVHISNPSSRTFTVAFQSKQANSTEHVIQLADDNIFEGRESFRLRIVDVQFSEQAAALFRVQDGLTNTSAEVIIADDDCEFKMSACPVPLLPNHYHET